MRQSKLPVLAAVAVVGLMTAGMSARAGEINIQVGISVPGAVAVVSNGLAVRHHAPIGVPVRTVVVESAPVVAYPVPVAVQRPVIVAAPRVHMEMPPAMYAPPPRQVTYVGYPAWDGRRHVRIVERPGHRHVHLHGNRSHRHDDDMRGQRGRDDDRGHRHDDDHRGHRHGGH
jgi:hypothetical protein